MKAIKFKLCRVNLFHGLVNRTLSRFILAVGWPCVICDLETFWFYYQELIVSTQTEQTRWQLMTVFKENPDLGIGCLTCNRMGFADHAGCHHDSIQVNCLQTISKYIMCRYVGANCNRRCCNQRHQQLLGAPRPLLYLNCMSLVPAVEPMSQTCQKLLHHRW